ncbi:hypothetical protein WJX72_009692 [[Myrmecia] bisecta]|uniref:Phasin domain-containing protein n=1 Tax=[Myrmecia] bisecta TaxID=41462 RepID=A0AAW1P4A6_9CHLO
MAGKAQARAPAGSRPSRKPGTGKRTKQAAEDEQKAVAAVPTAQKVTSVQDLKASLQSQVEAMEALCTEQAAAFKSIIASSEQALKKRVKVDHATATELVESSTAMQEKVEAGHSKSREKSCQALATFSTGVAAASKSAAAGIRKANDEIKAHLDAIQAKCIPA